MAFASVSNIFESTDENAWVECASPHSVSDLTTGTHTLEVRAIDEGDNISPVASYTWTVSSPTNCTDANVILTATVDSYVDESRTQENFGAAEQLVVRSSAPGQDARTLLNFAVPADIPANCELASARLRLTGDGDAGRTLQVLPLTEPWQENQVTWQNQPAVGASVATTQSGAGLRQWDVTAAIGAGVPYGFQIRDVTEEDETGAESSFINTTAFTMSAVDETRVLDTAVVPLTLNVPAGSEGVAEVTVVLNGASGGGGPWMTGSVL